MPSPDEIDPNELIMRRVLPSDGNTTRIEIIEGMERLTSPTMQPRANEDHLSFSRLKCTTPEALIEMARVHLSPAQMAGVSVWGLTVAEVMNIEDGAGGHLCVLAKPTTEDPGHCGVFSQDGKPYPPNSKVINRKLARAAHKIFPQNAANSLSQVDSVSTGND